MIGVVLVGVDSSETALKAAETAASLAYGVDCELYVLSAYEAEEARLSWAAHSGDRSRITAEMDAQDEARRRQAEAAEKTAETVANKLRENFPGLTITSKSAEGAPASSIVNEAEKLNANIVVVGNKRVQSPTRVLGTIAGAVARDVRCDVYIANTHQR